MANTLVFKPWFGVFAAFLLLFTASSLRAQNWQSLKMDALEARMSKGADTVYVVNFWATWCAPCVRELPHFDQLQKSYNGKPLKVLLVSVDAPARAKAALNGFLSRREVSSEVLHLNESKPHEFIDRVAPEWSGSIPATLIIHHKTSRRAFHEGEMSEAELQTLVKTIY